MRSIRQLLRQPIKTLFGVVLIALAVAVLSVCLGQSFAAEKTEQNLKETFQTAVLPTADYGEDSDAFVSTLAAEHPEIIKSISAPGLASAYIEGLVPDNFHEHYHLSLISSVQAPYDRTMLEVTITEIAEPTPAVCWQKAEIGGYMPLTSTLGDVVITVKSTVDRVLALQEGYPDCLGMNACLNLYMESVEAFEALDLSVGDRCLVYTADFAHSDFLLRSELSRFLGLDELGQWHDVEPLHLYDEEDLKYQMMYLSGVDHVGEVRINSNITGVDQAQVNQFMTVHLQLKDDASYPKYHFDFSQDGLQMSATQITDDHLMENSSGALVPVSQEEYAALYTQPTIVKLTGTAEEFLENEEGALWKRNLEEIEVNNHSFPVIGVDDLNYIADFLRRTAEISQGRNFSAEELDGGAKVCIISDTVAEKNGLSVGDTLQLRFYDNDSGIPGNVDVSASLCANPQANYYNALTTPLYDADTYTIIGIYDRDVDWVAESDNNYTFTPNAIFTPKTAIRSEMEYGISGFYRTIMLHNGSMDEFAALATASGAAAQFSYFDNGYSAVEDSISSYKELARQAMQVGVIVYGIILLLFMVIYPGQQRRALVLMDSLGARRGKRLRHVLISALGVLIPGTLLGAGAGIALWQSVVDRLTADITAGLSIEMDVPALISIVSAQLLFALLLVLLIAVPASRVKSLGKRK